MKRLALLLPVLALALPVCVAAPTGAQTVESLIAQRGSESDEKKERLMTKDADIKMTRNAKFEKLQLFESSEFSGQQIFFDGANQKNKWSYDTWPHSGLTIKWGHYFVDIQPYTYQCWLICGKWKYIDSPQALSIEIDTKTFTIKKTEIGSLRHYLPIAARELISSGANAIELKGFPNQIDYKLSQDAISLLAQAVDASIEIDEYESSDEAKKTKKELLLEAKDLFDDGLITESEYQEMREKILDSNN